MIIFQFQSKRNYEIFINNRHILKIKICVCINANLQANIILENITPRTYFKSLMYLRLHYLFCFWIIMLEKTLEMPLNNKEIKPVNPKGNQPWIFIEGLMLKLQYFDHLMKETTHWKRHWCCERLETKGEGGGRGWDG